MLIRWLDEEMASTWMLRLWEWMVRLDDGGQEVP